MQGGFDALMRSLILVWADLRLSPPCARWTWLCCLKRFPSLMGRGSILVGWEWQRLQFQLQWWLGELEALACVCASQVAASWWLLLCPGDGVSQSTVGPAGWVQVHAVVDAGDSGGNQHQPELSFLALWFNCPHELCDYCYFLKWKIPVLLRTAGAGKTWTNKTLKKYTAFDASRFMCQIVLAASLWRLCKDSKNFSFFKQVWLLEDFLLF